MKLEDLGGSDSLRRLVESMHTQSRLFDEQYTARHTFDALGMNSCFRKIVETQNRWRTEVARFANPTLGLTDAFERLASQVVMPSVQFDQLGTAKSFLASFEHSFASSTRKMIEDIEARERSVFESTRLTASHAIDQARAFDQQAEQIREVVGGIAASANYSALARGIVEGMMQDREPTAQLAASVKASFDVSQMVGAASVTAAFEKSMSAIARQHTEQYDQIRSRLKEMVSGVPTFDLATTAFLADFHGIAGIRRQLASLGVTPEEILGEGTAALDEEGDEVETRDVGFGWKARRLDDFRQLVVNLIASLIFAIYVVPYVANPDSDAINKRLEGVEELVRRLPELLAPQIEEIVRRELGADPELFAVGAREGKLRLDPQAGSAVIAVVFPNQILTLLDQRGKWIKVEFYDYRAQDVRTGWILKKYCERVQRQPRHR